jgi:adenosine kinase
MRIAVAGSIATDHLFTFEGRFVELLLPEQLSKVSLSFLATTCRSGGAGPAPTSPSAWACSGRRRCWSGRSGADAADYLRWLSDHGVDVSACASARRSPRRASPAPPTTTTPSWPPSTRARWPRRRRSTSPRSGELDLVVVAPDDPGRDAAHSASCRDRGVPFAADPSQQLAYMDGASIRALVDGATYLFTNEYEAGLVHDKTGWSPDDVLARSAPA